MSLAVDYASLTDAQEAVKLWNGAPDSVEHIGNFGNAVFKFTTAAGAPCVLRCTDLKQRSYEEIQGEMEFLEFLQTQSVPAYPCARAHGLVTQCTANIMILLIF